MSCRQPLPMPHTPGSLTIKNFMLLEPLGARLHLVVVNRTPLTLLRFFDRIHRINKIFGSHQFLVNLHLRWILDENRHNPVHPANPVGFSRVLRIALLHHGLAWSYPFGILGKLLPEKAQRERVVQRCDPVHLHVAMSPCGGLRQEQRVAPARDSDRQGSAVLKVE